MTKMRLILTMSDIRSFGAFHPASELRAANLAQSLDFLVQTSKVNQAYFKKHKVIKVPKRHKLADRFPVFKRARTALEIKPAQRRRGSLAISLFMPDCGRLPGPIVTSAALHGAKSSVDVQS